jgi:hypothetical protein
LFQVVSRLVIAAKPVEQVAPSDKGIRKQIAIRMLRSQRDNRVIVGCCLFKPIRPSVRMSVK